MDSEASTRDSIDLLERVLLDGNAEPTCVPLSLLKYITNSFSNEYQIGRGGFAVVYKGIVGKGVVAVKKLSTSNLPEIKFHREVQCLMKAKHKNIVRFLGYCSEVQGRVADHEGRFVMSDIRNWLLCFEYVPNGSLDKYITDASCGLEWRKRYGIIKGICEGLLHLHEKRILHLDLKPGNILVDEHMVPKITDFGLSMCLDEDQSRAFTANICGSLGYLPPEFFRGQRGFEGLRGFTSDIYSLGVIIVEVLTGKKWYPEDENVVENWMTRLEGSDQRDTQLEQVRVCTKIGIECMDLDPKKRPAARDIIDRLDETASTIETTSISSSSTEQQVNFLKEQYCQEKTTKLASDYSEKDNKEQAEIEELVEYVRKSREDHWQQGREEAPEEWLSWEAEYTEQNVSPQGSATISWEAEYTEQNVSPQGSATISSSNSGMLYKLNNLNIFNKARRNYVKNGGPILEKISSLKLIKKRDVKIICNYSNLVGEGEFGEVYKGLVDSVPVAVKKLKRSVRTNDQFKDQVIIQSRIRHKNIVQLIGVCLEVDIPMLVYEFLSRGSLHDILHGNNNVPLNLGLRLSIAAESACGLAYMHSMTIHTILDGNVKPSNILLDHNFVPKISDFGVPRMSAEYTMFTAVLISGDMAYMDPVSIRRGTLTQKSDVYSFGVVILELLTRRKVSLADNYSLVGNFLKNQHQGLKSTELFDKEIALDKDLELLDNLAEIAMECIDLDVDKRPTMMNLAKRLSILNKSRELALLQAS